MASFKDVRQIEQISKDIFDELVEAGEPFKMRNVPFGSCLEKWNLNYFERLLGHESVVVHESSETDLNFVKKNFNYTTCKISEFVAKLRDKNYKSHIYLRSTNANPRAKKAARIEDDFPALADDLRPPCFIPFCRDDKLYHSSVLRIASSRVQVWTHFDLYDNVLVQVVGTKRIILLPPEDSEYLYVVGDKSAVNNWDNLEECLRTYPLVARCSPRWCLLEPGESLFIPALWWHNIRTLVQASGSADDTSDHSIGFNIFWKDRAVEMFYAEGDVYGNKSLKPFEAALANLDKAVQHLNRLPAKYSSFYKSLLLQRLKAKLFPPPEPPGTSG